MRTSSVRLTPWSRLVRWVACLAAWVVARLLVLNISKINRLNLNKQLAIIMYKS
nr:MAG TPA: hypothetical protein [Caudoviricetes sp.]